MTLLSLLPPALALAALVIALVIIAVLHGRDTLAMSGDLDDTLYDVACGCVGFAIGFTLGFTLAGAV